MDGSSLRQAIFCWQVGSGLRWAGHSSGAILNKTAILTLIAAATVTTSWAQTTVQEWQARALRDFPQLRLEGSALNKRFLELYKERNQTTPDFFKNPQWPLLLAREASALAAADSFPPGGLPATPPSQGTAAAPAQDGAKTLALRPTWASKTAMSAGGGSDTMADLKRLLGRVGAPKKEFSPSEPIPIFGGATYLMPLSEAKEALGVSKILTSRTKIACAGFPDGLFYHAVDGRFDGHYNRMYIVTDMRDQVAGIHLVDETPTGSTIPVAYQDWRTYNFVNARVKSKRVLQIKHDARKDGGTVVIDSELYDPEKGRTLEISRFYVPQPIVDAILFCVQ